MEHQFHDIALRLLKRGAPIHQLSFRLRIDVEELRNLDVWETLYQLARSGRHTSATIFWLKTRAGAQTSPKQKEEYPYQYSDPPIIRVVDNTATGEVYCD
jgi:hypothetical protein